MAKKKKSSNLGKILYSVAVLLGLVAIAMLFVAAVKTPDTEAGVVTIEGVSYTGFQVAFGSSVKDVKELAFSFMALLPVVLVLVGVVLSALQITKKKTNKIFDFVIVVCFVAAGVLYFIMPSFIVPADTLLGARVELIASKFKLAIGSIVAAICSIIASIAVLAKVFSKN